MTSSPKLFSAMSHDGTKTFVILSTYTAQLNFSSPATFSFWIKSLSDTGQSVFSISRSTVSNHYFQLGVGPQTGTLANEIITVHRYEPAAVNVYIVGYTTANRNEIFDGNWHHVLLTWNNTSTKIYLDGLSKTVTTGSGTDNGTYGNIIGSTVASISSIIQNNIRTSWVNGQLDDVRLYSRVLTSAEIESLAFSRSRLNITSGIVGYWRLDQGTEGKQDAGGSPTVLDSSGNGYHGTPSGSPTWKASTGINYP
jgi:hypothetical protein